MAQAGCIAGRTPPGFHHRLLDGPADRDQDFRPSARAPERVGGVARFALTGKAENVPRLMEPARRQRRQCGKRREPPLVPLGSVRLAEPLETLERRAQQGFEFGKRVLAFVVGVVGTVVQGSARADDFPFRSRAEEDPAWRQDPPGLPDHGPVVGHMFDRLEGGVEIKAPISEGKARGVGQRAAKGAGARTGELRLLKGFLGAVGGHHPPRFSLPEESRPVPGSRGQVQHPLSPGVARGPAVARYVLVPEPGGGETVEGESFQEGVVGEMAGAPAWKASPGIFAEWAPFGILLS